MGRPDAMETGTFYPAQLFILRTLGSLSRAKGKLKQTFGNSQSPQCGRRQPSFNCAFFLLSKQLHI